MTVLLQVHADALVLGLLRSLLPVVLPVLGSCQAGEPSVLVFGPWVSQVQRAQTLCVLSTTNLLVVQGL